MPKHKGTPNWRPRTIALLRKAVETGSIYSAAGAIRERSDHLVEDTIRLAESTQVELMGDGKLNNVSYNEACRVAAERLEAA